MADNILKDLQSIADAVFHIHNDRNSALKQLEASASRFAAQVAVIAKLEPVAALIRDGENLPIRKLNYNIKRLSDDDSKKNPNSDSRWAKLQKLGCETAIYCMISLPGLATIPVLEYEWLLEYVRKYMEAQRLPLGWVAREQIRKVLANTLRCTNTAPFLEGTLPSS